MAMKAIANSTIRLGLINLPVQIAQAVETGNDVKFSMAGPNGEELEQRYVVKGTESLVAKDDIQKGIRDGDTFRPISKDNIDNIAAQTKLPDLNVSEVLSVDDWRLEQARITDMYYVMNNKKAGSVNSFKLFVDALGEERKVMVTKFTFRSRQKLLVLWPKLDTDGAWILMASGMSFANDIRSADESVRAHIAGNYSDAEMAMAKQLLGALTTDKPQAFTQAIDEAVPMRRQLVADAMQGKAITAPEQAEEQAEKNANLADALTQALAAAKQGDTVTA